MRNLLIKQAMVLPLGAMLIPILIAFFIPEYSSISQHISEVALLEHPIALIQRGAALVTGVSIFLFGGCLFVKANTRITGIAALLFGSSMISNGIFVMGSPLHGLYGLGFFMVLVPACFASECARLNRILRKVSLIVALLTMFYLWLMLSGFDPDAFRGLTQRIATVVIFGWYVMACYWLTSNRVITNKEATT